MQAEVCRSASARNTAWIDGESSTQSVGQRLVHYCFSNDIPGGTRETRDWPGRGRETRTARRRDSSWTHVVRDPCQLLRHERCASPGLVVCGKNRCRGSSGVSVSRRLVSSLVSRVPPVVAHGRVRADGRRREENRENRNQKREKGKANKQQARKSEFSRKE